MVVRLWMLMVCALTCVLVVAQPAEAQTFEVLHQVDGQIQHKTGAVSGMRVRLVRKDTMEPVGETFTRPEGSFVFTRVTDGDYLVETFETETFEATNTEVVLRPRPRMPISVRVLIELPTKVAPATTAAGVIAADVDLDVPKAALKHYRDGMKALTSGESTRGMAELREAIAIYPDYYAARLELGRELRLAKQYKQAEEILSPLSRIAPKRAEPRLEYGIVLLELRRSGEAAAELRQALKLEEANWATHLYLGWALLESSSAESEPHFKRALELNERKAARAHLALARLADAKGQRQLAIQHLETYISLVPNAPDTESARKLADKLRQ